MDPRLVRLFELGHRDDEVAAILRLEGEGRVPPGVRVVSRFRNIATVRVRRGDIPRVHDAPFIASMKPTAPLRREVRHPATGVAVATLRDARRPRRQQATGRGVVVGFVDWGFDFAHPDFRRPNGITRLLALWDQSAPRSALSPVPYGYGIVHMADEINAALATPDPYAALNYSPADSDLDGAGTHGTHVAGIAVGNGRAGGPSGIAPEADIVFVQLTTLDQSDPDLADSATVLEAIDFIRKIAGSRPWVVNLSLGQCGDPHDGTTLVEQGLDAALGEAPGCACVQSTGNYFTSRLHSSGHLRTGERRTLTWRVPAGGDTNELEIWYPGRDAFTVSLRAPDGARVGRAALGERVRLQLTGQTCGTLHHRQRDPNNLDNHIVLWLHPQPAPGDWLITLDGSDVADGRYHVWVQRGGDDDRGQAAFVRGDANPFFTTNSICNGHHTIVVGAYDPRSARRDVAPFSSAGPTRDGRPKPDLLAPGVDILSARSTPEGAAPGSGLQVCMTGTSMAAPHVAGTIALMFEAAPRRLSSLETRGLLLSNAQLADRPMRELIRYGSGYLDIDAAVEAARNIRSDTKPTVRGVAEMTTESKTNLAATHSGTDGWSDPLTMADTLIGIGGPFAVSPAALLTRVLQDFADPTTVDPLTAAGLLNPAALFDGFTTAQLVRLRPLLDHAFTVVAYPRQRLPRPEPGDLLLRRALGEPGLGHVAFIAGQDAYSCEEARRRGLWPESMRPGLYARVVEAGTHPHRLRHRFARRIAGAEGTLPTDTLILRARLRKSPRGGVGLAEDIDVDRAVQANRQYGLQLGWQSRFNDIVALLGVNPSASPQDFAQAISDWQDQHGLTVDGILGPDSWRAMQPLLARPPGQPRPPATAASLPPAPYNAMPLGLDFHDALKGRRHPLADFSRLARLGKTFVILKASQEGPDQVFTDHYEFARDAGLLRGAYHFFTPNPVQDQVDLFVGLVHRVGPGDLPPSLDVEDGSLGLFHHYHYIHHFYDGHQEGTQAGTNNLLNDLQEWLNRVEAALGRTPIVYTGVMWRDDLQSTRLSNYPLWTIPRHFSTQHWSRAAILQYAEDGGNWLGFAHYTEPNIDIPGTQYDAYNGSIYELRGLADLGRTAPHLVGNLRCIAHADLNGRIHLLEYAAGSWLDQDVFSATPAHVTGTLPLAAGDPAAIAMGNEQVIAYRSADGGVHALTRTLTDSEPSWRAIDITGGGGRAIGDPFVLLFENNVQVVYWDQFNAQVHVTRVNGVWQAESFVDRVRPNTPSQISGSATAYTYQNVLHIVSRSRADGHLYDFSAPANGALPQDLTAASHSTDGVTPPAATYRPTTYTPSSGAPRIVFRGLQGPIWQIERDTLVATNLSAASGAPIAAGNPTAVVANTIHIFYRQADGTVTEIFADGSSWKTRPVCSNAASDPSAFVDELGHAAVSFRAADGAIWFAQFVNGAWKCENATRSQTGSSGGSAPGGLETALARQEESTPARSMAALKPEKLKISDLPEIILTLGNSGHYEGFFRTPIHLRPDQTPYAQSDARELELIGRVQIEDSGILRNYSKTKDGKEWPLGGVTGSARLRLSSGTDGPSFSGAAEVQVQPDGTFLFPNRFGVGGFTRSLTLYPKIEFKNGKSIVATVAVELIDLDGFVALIDPSEKARPSSQTHLQFLASVRKIYQGGPKDALNAFFDLVLYRNRGVPPLVLPGTAQDMRFKLYNGKDGLFADTEWVDIGHVLTGIEGSPKQDPSNQQDPDLSKRQQIGVPPRRELIVTWAGDLGSALQKYISVFWYAVDTGYPLDLNDYLLRFADRRDLLGDIDGINIGSGYDSSRSLAENLRAYYGQKSRRRYHEFIANSRDRSGKAELPLVPGKKPPQLSTQARQSIAENISSQFLIPLQLLGKIYPGSDPNKRKLVDNIIEVNSPEMGIAVEYFTRFLEDGLAKEP